MPPVGPVTARSRRLLVSGGSRLSAHGAQLWRELGKLLASDDRLVVITGGFAERKDAPGVPTADRAVIDGVLEGLQSFGMPPEDRIETLLPDPAKDWSKIVRFREGRVQELRRRTSQARRFAMVQTADVVVAIGGDTGTRSILDVALAIERPTLALPFEGGAAADAWRDAREEIPDWFKMSADEIADFDRVSLSTLHPKSIAALAARVHTCLLRGFVKSCFVMMPFDESDPIYERALYDEAIRPALIAHGVRPERTDRSVVTGNILDAIRDRLRHCDFALADTTGDNPNVMYELGIAHAERKPVILVRRASRDGSLGHVPFDLKVESITAYADKADLRRRLEPAIAVLLGRIRSIDDR